MTDEITLTELETRVAQTAAQLLQTVLQVARLGADPGGKAALDTVTACRLIVSASVATVQIELTAPVAGRPTVLYAAQFEECRVLQ